ncbi:ABC transporter ATP-binding protein [Enterovirga rhinocerotis]|uniref:Amino acid/amide ABC transporter ATP-binding protein 1 (HAAT family) n=1 Tax=Enterovirga rhinocerotis TaxID=1339210 RepID=A0A4R7C5X3_9HYPH|nr:ABC transporter ATP-binding protein [Enterovirga rhinocerotis]TDR93302.1 amino acid/amide ABC transporter ATP-binding protein 1 (HAAT family) [Enterovirga rhinocerotis]
MRDPAPSGSAVLQADNVSKRFGGNTVFADVSLSLGDKEIVGVIGPNGAGKTTLINILSGQLEPTAGRVRLRGGDVTGVSLAKRAKLGVVRTFQQTKTFKSGTVEENLRRAQMFSGSNLRMDEPYVRALLDRAGLLARLDHLSDTLPYGMQKMLGLIMAILTKPGVLLLDEPAAGLERSERFFIDDYVAAVVRELGASVLLVEHDMELVKRLCPRIAVLDGGRLIAEGPPAEVLSRRDVIEAYLGTADEEDLADA